MTRVMNTRIDKVLSIRYVHEKYKTKSDGMKNFTAIAYYTNFLTSNHVQGVGGQISYHITLQARTPLSTMLWTPQTTGDPLPQQCNHRSLEPHRPLLL